MDFDDEEWDFKFPIILLSFKLKKTMYHWKIEDTSHKSYKLIFKNGAKFNMFRVVLESFD